MKGSVEMDATTIKPTRLPTPSRIDEQLYNLAIHGVRPISLTYDHDGTWRFLGWADRKPITMTGVFLVEVIERAVKEAEGLGLPIGRAWDTLAGPSQQDDTDHCVDHHHGSYEHSDACAQ